MKEHPSKQMEEIEQLLSDYYVKCSNLQILDVHLYSFEHRLKNLPLPKWGGVPRGSELDFIFGQPFNPAFEKYFYSFTKEEKELSKQMMSLWRNFAYTG
ncbi:hypothetical protein Ciccas_000932 [Cichlidogyrus casuarinus]|uniref:Carboxylesterase type B domain-containing protein n=1 Tax=Cichlidogyrus casuarinus TaxID=1844966 RepID=A0ABD2QLI1_9PLAT